jgi:hypothetical protein
MNRSESSLYELQNKAFVKLSQSVRQHDAEERQHHIHNLRRHVPLASTDHLVGVDAHVGALSDLLLAPSTPWLIAVSGIGGIGKSTLAAATALHTLLAGAWDGIAWVAARSSFLDPAATTQTDEPRLSVEALLEQLFDQLLPDQPKPAAFTDGKALYLLVEHCRRYRCLIVVDNLESVAAAQQVLPTLRRLVNPTKVLLGIREKLFMEPDVTDYAVPELSEANALALLRRSTAQHFSAAELNDESLRLVYAVTGGNPQALRVVAGQLVSFGLDDVLADLRQVRSRRIEQLYDHIYRRAWDGLTPPERHALLAMATVDAGGETLSYIVQLAGLSERQVVDALETLIIRNLVERRRYGQSMRYTLHNLTRTFLYQRIVDWDEGSESGDAA